MIKDRATVIAQGESKNSVASDLRPIHPDEKDKMVILVNTMHGMLPVLKLVSSTWVWNSVSNEDKDVDVIPKRPDWMFWVLMVELEGNSRDTFGMYEVV